MGEYGSGMSLAQVAELDKERVKHALNGELVCGEDENGFVYEPATREECDRYILEVVDSWYHQAKRLADNGRAIERLCKSHGFDPMSYFHEYVLLMAEAENEYATFAYEHEIDSVQEEARSILDGILGGEDGA